MDVDPLVLLTIAGMAVATYATRAGGLWLMGRINLTPRIEAWLRHIPGAVLVSLIAPSALSSGPPEALATLLTVLVAARSGNIFFAMLAGIAAVWGLRLLF